MRRHDRASATILLASLLVASAMGDASVLTASAFITRKTGAAINAVDLIRSVFPAPNTRSIASRAGFDIGGVRFGEPLVAPRPGDCAVALVSLLSLDGRLQPIQWLVRLTLKKSSANAEGRDFTCYTNVGDKFVYHSGVTAMSIETLGPIRSPESPGVRLAVKASDVDVSTDFLTLDLYRSGNVLFNMQQAANQQAAKGPDVVLSVGPSVFPSGAWEANKKTFASMGITSDDRRSFAGAAPALMQFMEIVQQIPDLKGILMEVLDKPSVIDVFRHGLGTSINFQIQGAGPSNGHELFWRDPARRPFGVSFFSVSIYEKPALAVALYVTSPAPPLEVSAGILSLAAWSPSKADKVVVVRVLSSAPGLSPVAAK